MITSAGCIPAVSSIGESMPDRYIAALRQIQRLVNDALREVSAAQSSKKVAPHPKTAPSGGQLSFSMNILAFMKKYARGRSGPQKFTLLVAYLVKGDIEASVSWQAIDGQWNRMTTLLGPSNPVHGNRAKANGWVEPVKTGTWKLTDSWKEVLVG